MMHSMLYFFILLFVQVVVESLPVSSSAHVQLAQSYMDAMGWGTFTGVFEALLHLMHLPTLLIVMFFFRNQLFFLCGSLRRSWPALRSFSQVGPVVGKIITLTAISDVITIIFFIFFKLFPPAMPLGIGFCVTALMLYSLRWTSSSRTLFNWRHAVTIGIVQGIALLPGVSRFAAVYACACWFGLPQHKAFAITWLVQWPLILAACAKSVYELWAADQLMPLLDPWVLLMTSIATLCGLVMFYVSAYLAREGKLWLLSFYMVVPMGAWLYLWCVL